MSNSETALTSEQGVAVSASRQAGKDISAWMDPFPAQTAARKLRAEREAIAASEAHDKMIASRKAAVLAIAMSLVLLAGFVAFWYGMVVGVPGRAPAREHTSPGWNIIRYGWCALIAWALAKDMRRGKLVEAWAVARQVTPRIVLQNILILVLTVAASFSLLKLIPALDRSWLYLLPNLHGTASNIYLMPVTIKYFGILFIGLFAVCIPSLARGEEMSYRHGTRNWRHGVWRSIRFGLAHCVVGVPLYAGLALTIGGLWFTHQYFQGGVERSTLHHATCNWIVTAILLVIVIVWSFS